MGRKGFQLSHTPLGVSATTPLAYHPRTGKPVYPIAGGATDEMTHSQCVSRMEEIAGEMERLREKQALSAQDEEYRDNIAVEFDELDQRRARLETQSAAAHIVARTQGIIPRQGAAAAPILERGAPDFDRDAFLEPDSIEEHRFKNPWDLSEIRTYGRSQGELIDEYRSRALSAVAKMQQSNDSIRSTATDLIERWDDEEGKLSRLVLAISSPEYLRAWSKMAVNPVNTDLSAAERRALEFSKREQRALSLADPSGGYLVPFQLDPTVILTSDGSYNDIRRIARQVVATGDVWNGVSAGAVQWSFDPEASEVSDDAPAFAAPAITVRTARGFVPISLEARMDAANIAAEVARLLAQGKDDLEAVKFVLGTAAANEPIGLITALSAAAGSVVASTTTDTFAFNDLYRVQGALAARYRTRAVWLANNLTYNLIRQASPGGEGVWRDVAGDRPAALLGRPAYEAEALDGTVTAAADNFMAVLGDFDNYVIADRVGMTVDFIPHLFGANRRPTGQSGWFAFYRVGADVTNAAAFRVLNVT